MQIDKLGKDGQLASKWWWGVHHSQTSKAFFILFSGILFDVKWKHGQGCIK